MTPTTFFKKAIGILKQRQKVHSRNTAAFKATGDAWTSLLELHYGIRLPNPIPVSLVMKMYAANKLVRSSYQSAAENPDSLLDACNYIALAAEEETRE